MSADRKRIRVTVIAEDSRTRGFIRRLLTAQGFDKRRVRFEIAPKGLGAAERWVLERYPHEVQALRSKNYQRGRRLIAVRDGDSDGWDKRKQQFDAVLIEGEMPPRGQDEGIALLVPTWSIETWLLALLGEPDVVESAQLKHDFAHRRSSEQEDLRAAALAWSTNHGAQLPSLVDGRAELKRIDP